MKNPNSPLLPAVSDAPPPEAAPEPPPASGDGGMLSITVTVTFPDNPALNRKKDEEEDKKPKLRPSEYFDHPFHNRPRTVIEPWERKYGREFRYEEPFRLP